MAIYLIKDEELETSKTSDELSEDELKGVSGGGFTVNKEKTCPSCQSRIPANATECPVCGGKIKLRTK